MNFSYYVSILQSKSKQIKQIITTMANINREELMKEQKKFLVNRIERLEDLLETYRKRIEAADQEMEHLKAAHQAEIETAKEDAYSKFLTANGDHLERFVKEFIQKKLVVDLNVSGPYLNTTVYIGETQGRSSDTEVIKQDTYGTIV